MQSWHWLMAAVSWRQVTELSQQQAVQAPQLYRVAVRYCTHQVSLPTVMYQSQYSQVQEVSVKLKQAASTQSMQNTQDEQSKSCEGGQQTVSPQHSSTTIPTQPIRIQESLIIHQSGFINDSEQIYKSAASAHQHTSNTRHNQQGPRCTHKVHTFMVPEDAHAVTENNPHELHCCDRPEVLGQTQTGDVRQLTQSHGNPASQKPFCELPHVQSWPAKLIGETQRAREEDHEPEDVVDLNGVDVNEFLCHHHCVAMEGHCDQHGSRHEGHHERALCEIVLEVRVYFKLRVKEDHDWRPVDHEEHSCEASGHSHSLVAIDGDAVDVVVKDEDKKRRDAVEGAGDCEGQVELRERKNESLHHHDTVAEDEITEVPWTLKLKVALSLPREEVGAKSHRQSTNYSRLEGGKILFIGVDESQGKKNAAQSQEQGCEILSPKQTDEVVSKRRQPVLLSLSLHQLWPFQCQAVQHTGLLLSFIHGLERALLADDCDANE